MKDMTSLLLLVKLPSNNFINKVCDNLPILINLFYRVDSHVQSIT